MLPPAARRLDLHKEIDASRLKFLGRAVYITVAIQNRFFGADAVDVDASIDRLLFVLLTSNCYPIPCIGAEQFVRI